MHSPPPSASGPAGPPPRKSGGSSVGWILALVGGIGCLGLFATAGAGLFVFAIYKQEQEEQRSLRDFDRWRDGDDWRRDDYGDLGRGDDPFGKDPYGRGEGGGDFGRNDRFGDPGVGRGGGGGGGGGGLGVRDTAPDTHTVHDVPVEGSPQLGPDDALVTIVAFSDFECPFCARVTSTLERIRDSYGDDVRLVFKHRPLPFHKRAAPAAHASIEVHEDAGDEAFWKMHDLMFDNQRALDDSDLVQYARQAGASGSRVRRALRRTPHQDVIDRDERLALEVGATGTPTFFINGVKLTGAQPYTKFQELIDEEMSRARGLVRSGTPRSKVYEELIEQEAL